MQVQDALSEFADLLTVGSAALGNVVDKVEPRARRRAKEVLVEVEIIASRLRDIASEIAGSARNGQDVEP